MLLEDTQSLFHIRAMPLQGDGLYTALLIKVFAYLWPYAEVHRTLFQSDDYPLMRTSVGSHLELAHEHFSSAVSGNVRILEQIAN